MKITRDNLIAMRDLSCVLFDEIMSSVQEDRTSVDGDTNPMVLENLDVAESLASQLGIALQDAIDHFEHTPEQAAAWQKKQRAVGAEWGFRQREES